jgi:hypothetical protein
MSPACRLLDEPLRSERRQAEAKEATRMGRFNEQVVRLTRALAETREILEKTESTIPRMTEQHKMLESMVEAEVDAVKRARMEFEIKDMKRAVERYKTGLERMKEQEQSQATQLRE